jgi:hypothetical protein
MKTIASVILIFVLTTGIPATAQQDPDDPGVQDSVMVQTVAVDQAMRSVLVEMYIATDDPVMYLNIPLLWTSENDSIYPDQIYYQEIWGEDWGDTIMIPEHRINVFGFSGYNDTLNTHGIRQLLLSIQFQVTNQTSQIITIDSTWDDRNGSLVFGLSDGVTEITPAFVPGGIIYNPQGSSGDLSLTPNTFFLNQNYPNPFNAQTTISYSLSESCPVTLTIYNLLGQKAATLFDGEQTAGEHSFIWDAQNQPSGVYFARMASRSLAQKVKMIILK